MHETLKTALFCALMGGATFAAAAERSLQFAAGVGLGRLDGTSYERVYTEIDHGPLNGTYHRLSELIWDAEEVYGVNASLLLGFNHVFDWQANLFYGLTDGTGGMEDYDWFLYDRPDYWTHLSRSTVTVEEALDADLRGTFHLVRNFPLTLDAFLGWRYMKFHWTDRGIDYVYSSLGARDGDPDHGYSSEQANPDAIRDIQGEDNSPGITYEQTFHIPYVGAGLGIGRGRLRAKGEISYSPIVAAQDEDHHLLRGLVFDGTFVGGTYLSWKATLTWDIRPHVFLSASFNTQTIEEFRGDMTMYQGGVSLGTLHDGASIEHDSRQVTLAVGAFF